MSQISTAESPLTLEEMGISGRTGKEQYLSLFLFLYGGLYNVIASSELAKEPMKVYYVIKEMINLIPIKSDRETINKVLDKNLKDKGIGDEEKEKTLTDDMKKHILINASLDTLGNITDFVNKHFDLTLENTVGVS